MTLFIHTFFNQPVRGGHLLCFKLLLGWHKPISPTFVEQQFPWKPGHRSCCFIIAISSRADLCCQNVHKTGMSILWVILYFMLFQIGPVNWDSTEEMINQVFLLTGFEQEMSFSMTSWCTFGPEKECQEEWCLRSFAKLLVVLILQLQTSMKSYCAADDKESACKAFLLLPFVIFWRCCQERSVLIRLGNCRATLMHSMTEGRKQRLFSRMMFIFSASSIHIHTENFYSNNGNYQCRLG